MKRVVIIGGGIAGLAAAVHLRSAAKAYGKDIDVLILEKNDRVGGKILTERAGDYLVEGGPDSFLPEKVWTVNLARPFCQDLAADAVILFENKDIDVLSVGLGSGPQVDRCSQTGDPSAYDNDFFHTNTFLWDADERG